MQCYAIHGAAAVAHAHPHSSLYPEEQQVRQAPDQPRRPPSGSAHNRSGLTRQFHFLPYLCVQAAIEKWMDLGATCEAAVLTWVEPFAEKADAQVRT
jgi:hypothetical protein